VSAANRISVSVVTSIFGNRVVAVRIAERMTSTPTITLASAFSQPGLVHGPRTALSLQSSKRNTVADGSSTPARACTTLVIVPKGAPGMSTIAAARITIVAWLPWNRFARPSPWCSECGRPKTSPNA
jgi:hypothetical protein